MYDEFARDEFLMDGDEEDTELDTPEETDDDEDDDDLGLEEEEGL